MSEQWIPPGKFIYCCPHCDGVESFCSGCPNHGYRTNEKIVGDKESTSNEIHSQAPHSQENKHRGQEDTQTQEIQPVSPSAQLEKLPEEVTVREENWNVGEEDKEAISIGRRLAEEKKRREETAKQIREIRERRRYLKDNPDTPHLPQNNKPKKEK